MLRSALQRARALLPGAAAAQPPPPLPRLALSLQPPPALASWLPTLPPSLPALRQSLAARLALPALPRLPALPWLPSAVPALSQSLAALPRAALATAQAAVEATITRRLRRAALLAVAALCLVAFSYGAGTALPAAVTAYLGAARPAAPPPEQRQ